MATAWALHGMSLSIPSLTAFGSCAIAEPGLPVFLFSIPPLLWWQQGGTFSLGIVPETFPFPLLQMIAFPSAPKRSIYELSSPPSMLPLSTVRYLPPAHPHLASPPWTQGEIPPPSTPTLLTIPPGTLPEYPNLILSPFITNNSTPTPSYRDRECLRIRCLTR